MPRFWNLLVLVTGLVASPALVSAQSLHAPVCASVAPDDGRVEVHGISFLPSSELVVTTRALAAQSGRATMITATYMGAQGPASDAFAVMTVFDEAPSHVHAESPEHAIALRTLEAVERSVKRPIASEQIGLSLDNVPLTLSYFIDFGIGNTTAVFAVARLDRGYLSIYLQHGQQTESTALAFEMLISSIRIVE